MSGEAGSYYAGAAPGRAGYQDLEQGPPAPQGQPYGPPAGGGDAKQASGPVPGRPQQPFDADAKPTFDGMFQAPQRKFKDIWAGALFLATVGGFTAVSGLTIHAYATTRAGSGSGIYDGGTTFGLTTNTLICMLVCIGVAVVLSMLYMVVVRVFTKAVIWVSGIINVALGLATAIYMLYHKYTSGGVVFLIFAVFSLICFISWIPRIPFSEAMLRGSLDVSRRFGHVYLVSLVGGLAGAAFSVWYAVTMVAVYVKYEPGNSAAGNPACDAAGGGCSRAKVIGLMAFITFAGYWISEWLKNTIHAAIAGVYGTWFYTSPGSPAPRGTTRGACRRVLTRSFGSISLGSLLIAIIRFLRFLVSLGRRSSSFSSNPLTDILACLVGCLLSMLDWAVQFVNRYAFCNVALYGSTYFEAARDTWTMLKARGIDALANDCLVGPVFGMAATFVAYATALTAYVFLRITDPPYNQDGAFTPVVVAYAFLVGLQICNVFTVPISSGVDTLFVAMGWDPYVMRQNHGDLYQRIVSVYPSAEKAIQGDRWKGVGRG